MKFPILSFAATVLLVPTALLAQAPSTTPAPKPTVTGKSIQERKTDQQERIAQGIKSGQLTPAETARLEKQEAGINKEEAGMKAQDNGHLTKADKALLNKQQNQQSRRIHNTTHDVHHK
jgi:hypothetical protein